MRAFGNIMAMAAIGVGVTGLWVLLLAIGFGYFSLPLMLVGWAPQL